MEISGIMVLVVAVTMIVSSPAWYIANKKKYFFKWEVLVPALSIALWYFVHMLSMNYHWAIPKSLSNIAETTFFIPAVNIISAYCKTFVLDRFIKDPRKAAYYFLIFNLVAALLIYFLTPMLPE